MKHITLRVRIGAALLTVAGAIQMASAADPLSTWNPRTSPYGTTNTWRGVAFGNGRFVACGSRGLVATSADGTQWSPEAADTPDDFYSVTFAAGMFVATGEGGLVATSVDGVDWQLQDPDSNAHLYHVNHNNGLFVTVSDGGVILSSPDGIAWTDRGTGTTNRWRASAYGNGAQVVVGYRTESATSYTRAAVSPALADWELLDTGGLFYLSGLVYGDGKFVACGYGGLVQSSEDGVTWTAPAYAGNEWLNFVAHANGVYLAVGESEMIVSSPDGVTWTNRHSGTGFGTPTLRAAAFGNNTWVTVGTSSVILQSDPVNGGAPVDIVLSSPVRSGNQFSFTFSGELGQEYLVEATTDFSDWLQVTNLACTVSPMPCTVLDQPLPATYYRVVRP